MKTVAFYVMNEKGFYALQMFIEEFGAQAVEYVVTSSDHNMKKDFFHDIGNLCDKYRILWFDRVHLNNMTEKEFLGFKFVIGWRWIIKNCDKLIVFHDSLLPKYRGFAPLVNMLIAGEKLGGVTALCASDEYDRGDIIMQKVFKIHYPISIKECISQIKVLYYELVKDIFTLILSNKPLPQQQQDEKKATYSLWLNENDYFINWNQWSAKKIKRFIDAVGYPYDNAKTYCGNEVIKILDATIVNDVKIEQRQRHVGKVIFMKKNVPVVVCKKGLLGLKDIRDQNNEILDLSFRSKFY